MPIVLDNRMSLLLLFLVIPAQYIISVFLDSSLVTIHSVVLTWLVSKINILKLVSAYLALDMIKPFIKYADFESWGAKLYKDFEDLVGIARLNQEKLSTISAATKPNTSTRPKNYYFATSPEPRNPRPKHVKFRIGQVIRHKINKFRGVIFGWDERTLAPPAWMFRMYGRHAEKVKEMPSYAVLMDARDEEKRTAAYVRQDELELVLGTQVLNDEISEHFESFNGNIYVPRPKLRKLYPND